MSVSPNQRDRLAALVLFAVALALYVPVRSRLAYHWDSVEFAQAIKDYNLAVSQPHPPGYFLYVMFGRLVNAVVGDPHASLVAMSLLCGGALVAIMYRLGTDLFGRRCGAVAAVLTMTSPLIWFHSAVALTYVVDSFLVSLFVWWAWLALQRGGTWADIVGLGILLGVIAGVRQQTVPGLLPLAVFVFAKFRLQKVAIGLSAMLLVCAAWALPMMMMTGGWDAYWEAFQRHGVFNALRTFGGTGWDALLWNVFFLGLFCSNGLMLGVVPLAGLIYRKRDAAMNFVLLWVIPMILIAVCLSFIVLPGHVMCFLPGLILATAVVVARFPWAATAMLVGVNVFAFLAWPVAWDRVFYGTGLTARALCEHDRQLSRMVELIRLQYKPADTAIVHAVAWLPQGMRHFMYYLPEFDHYQLAEDRAIGAPSSQPMVSAKAGRIVFVHKMDLANKRTVLLFVPPGQSLQIFEPYLDLTATREVPGSGGQIYELAADLAVHRQSCNDHD